MRQGEGQGGRGGRAPGSRDTRDRLFNAAVALFSELGFDAVTVREICTRAEANLAAVSYHFGDKLGLYLEVVRAAAERMKLGNQSVMAAEGSGAAARLGHYIRTYLPRLMLVDQDRYGWVHRLMRHEMAEPTPAARLIMDEAILPRIRYLSGIVAELLECPSDDPRVKRAVASIQSQCLFYLPDPFRDRVVPGWFDRTPEGAAAVADHVAEFSLAGIEAMKRAKNA
ncbi:MAG: CerR family C-terminal domain-containing protein [Gemmatimonadales bacterium]